MHVKTIAARYSLVQPIGRGAHGEVWDAKDMLTDEQVAIKLFLTGFGSEPLRVRREIATLRLLRDPGVVRLFDEGIDQGQAFLVMERIAGSPFPGRDLPCSWATLSTIAFDLLETLGRIHQKGIVHRDLKPENVLITPLGHSVLLDFGLSEVLSLNLAQDDNEYLLGTPKYLAPEQIRGEPVTPATDLYAVGLLLYEALSGCPPHIGQQYHQLLAARLGGPPTPLAQVALAVPSSVAAMIDRLLAIEQDERPQSAATVARALGKPQSVDDPAQPLRPKRVFGASKSTSDSTVRQLLTMQGASPDQCASIARKARSLALSRARDGHLSRATRALEQGLKAIRKARRAADHPEEMAEETAMLCLLVEIAVRDSTPKALDKALIELCRSMPTTPDAARLDPLVRAALALAAGSDRALALAQAVDSFDDPRLDRCRHGLCVLAARQISQDQLETVLARAKTWADACSDPMAQAAFAGWMGRLSYQQGQFEQAAQLHARAAKQEPWTIDKIFALLHCASSWVEAFRFDDAHTVAEHALDLAIRCRHAHHEAMATWILRHVAYRRSEPLTPDPDFVEAAADVGVPDLEGLIALTEAAFAWRSGQNDLAAQLARRSHKLWTGMKKKWAAHLARALQLACTQEPDPRAIQDLAKEARKCPVHGLGIQMLGLLALTSLQSRQALARDAKKLAQTVPQEQWQWRMEVLSVTESLQNLGIPVDPAIKDLVEPPSHTRSSPP